MADQVSRMPSGGLSASFMRLLMNFLAWCLGRPVVSSAKGDEVDVWISVEFGLLSSLGHVFGWVLTAAMRARLLEKGDTMATSRYVAEALRLKTRSIRTCSRTPCTTV